MEAADTAMNRGSLSMSNARPSTIVIVDDDVVTNRMLQAILTRSGFAAVGAFDAAGGLSKIRDTQPDLVLLDVQLPDGDGFDLCQRLHLETGLAQVPVLFVSSNEDVASKVRGFAAGGVDYIPKPFAGEEVIARVSTHLRLKHAYEKLAELQAERVQRLAMAQETIMPAAADLPEARFQIALRQTLQAGGDFYDVIPVGPQMVDYVVADASGHDLAASFWTAALKTLLAEYAHLASSPMNVLRSINAALCRILPEGVYFTLTYARLNRRIHRLVLANAGHPPALVLPSHAEQAFLNDLESDVVGAFPDAAFATADLSVAPGDRLFLFSDGLVELDGSRDRGITRLAASCAAHRSLPLEASVQAIVADAIGETQPTDDVLLMGIEV